LIDNLSTENKNYRSLINQIALYSQGSYTVQDMYNMTVLQLEDIKNEMFKKADEEKQAIERSRGTNRKTF